MGALGAVGAVGVSGDVVNLCVPGPKRFGAQAAHEWHG